MKNLYAIITTLSILLFSTGCLKKDTFFALTAPNADFNVSVFSASFHSMAFQSASLNTARENSEIWNFGDGQTATISTTHEYSQAGNYQVIHKIYNSAGFDIKEKDIVVP